MAFYYLLLGHLFGDFVLQTDKIADNKVKYWQWSVLHVLIVTLCIFIFSIPFGILTSMLILFNGILHFVLDYYKPDLVKLSHLPEIAGFLIDQLLHILLIYLISLSAVPYLGLLLDLNTVKLLLVLVFVTFFSAVLNQFVLRIAFPRTNNRFFEEGEKQIGILTRLFVTLTFYLAYVISPLFLILLIAVAAVFVLQYRFRWNTWMSPKHLSAKLLLDTAVSAAGICFIFLL